MAALVRAIVSSAHLEIPLVIEHPRLPGSALAVGESGALVQCPGGDVGLARAEVDVSGAALSRMLHRRLEQRPPKAVTAALRDNVELLQVGIERSGVERRTEAKLGEPVWSVPRKENGDLAALDQRRRPIGDRVRIGRQLVELDVERVKQPAERGRIGGARQPEQGLRVLGQSVSPFRSRV